MSNDLHYFDVNDLSELTPLAKGLRYFDFIGGSKEFRCYIVSEDMARNRFMEKYEHLLDECLKPIYTSEGIVVKQDASFGLPGFYVVSFLKHFRTIDEIDEVTYLRLQFVMREIRKGMREKLGIQHTHIYYEEKNVVSQNVHYWIVPIDVEKYPRLYNLDIKKYLDQFLFSQNREKIIHYNASMKEYIRDVDLLKRESELTEVLNRSIPTYTAPATIDFNVNGACNLNCTWCWGPDHKAKEELTNEQWKQMARRLQILGTKNVTFTGGEPLLKKGLADILKYLHEDLGLRTTLSTNGILLKKLAMEVLPHLDDIGMPIDGHIKEVNQIMRIGTSKHFDKVLESILLVQTQFPHIDLTVRTVVSKKNAQSVPLIGKTLIDYGIDPTKFRWKFYQVTPMGVRKEDIMNGDWILSASEFEEVMREVEKQNPQFPYITKLTTDMHVGRYFHIYPDGASHIFVTGNDGYPTSSPLGNIGNNFDLVIKNLNDFDLALNNRR